MREDQFTKLFKYMQKEFADIKKDLATKANASDMQTALGLLDTLAKRQEISDDERLVMAHQLTKIHEWVEQAAERIDLKFAH